MPQQPQLIRQLQDMFVEHNVVLYNTYHSLPNLWTKEKADYHDTHVCELALCDINPGGKEKTHTHST